MPFLGTTGGGSVKQYGGQANLGYFIKNSLRFRASAGAYLNRTPATASNRKTWTWSGWVKRGVLGGSQFLFDEYSAASDNDVFTVYFTSSNTLTINGYTGTWRETTQVFRDPAAWYHIVIVLDTTQATAGNRVKLYVNGVEVTSFSSTTNPTLNADLGINQAASHTIGRYVVSPIYLFDGYMGEINFIDGQSLTPSSFGKTDNGTGQWIPKKFAGTYGTNGFYLKFADASAATAAAIGKDSSPNGNNWTPNNISVTAGTTYDAMIDSPTLSGAASNYCVINPLDKTSTITSAGGNLDITLPAAVSGGCGSTFSVSSGKWYWEITPTSGANVLLGITLSTYSQISANDLFTVGYGYYQNSGNKYVNGTGSAYGASYAANDVIGIALDLDGNTITFYKNNSSQGAISISAGTYKFTAANGSSPNAQLFSANFGQRPFSYTPPSGFKSLNAFNLP
jgi:hypothetical protein